jgi:hypothetical protein
VKPAKIAGSGETRGACANDHGIAADLLYLIALLMFGTVTPAQQFSFRPYTPAEGLTNLAVGHLALGANGDLWVGTDGVYSGTTPPRLNL